MNQETRQISFYVLVCACFPSLVCVLGDMFFPFWGHFGWLVILAVSIVTMAFGWFTVLDWRQIRKYAFTVADTSAAECKRYVILRLRRKAPPFMLWAVIVHDADIRVYMGFNFWGGGKLPVDLVKRGFRHRQVT